MAVVCSNCAGKLIFNPATQRLECATCGSSFRPEDVEDKNADLHSKYYDTRVYVCSHCGAEVITSDTESSTFCVYCGNPAIVFNRVSQEYRPDGLVPFQITKEEAVKYIKLRFLKNPIIPKEIKSKCVPENLRGIYIPYWIVNADYTEADYIKGEVKRGKSTETRYYSRAGEVQFKNIPIDGSNILNDDISRKLEPFYLEEAKDFDEDYLNGFYSNTSDLNYFDLRASTAYRCHKLFEDEVVKTIKAKNIKIMDSIYHVDIHDDPIYMMMPVWFFTFKYDNKPYTILVNGQTGKVVGTMPWQKKKVYSITISVFILTFALCVFLSWASINKLLGMTSFYTQGFAVLFTMSSIFFAKGFTGLRRILNNLKLTQSEAMFKFVRKRQG
ncbi:MAG: hypothetical protein IKG30_04320 [Clostridiales bacterium]|nr:hypothetical protein [Clostridiales bacterium]